MKFNQIKKIGSDAGDYIILTDYGYEGLSVYGQYTSLEEALSNIGRTGNDQAIVKLINFNIDIMPGPIEE